MKQKGLRMSTVLLLALIGTVLVVLLSILLLTAVVILIAMLIISAILSHVLSQPIRGLAAAMEQFEQHAESYMQIQSRRYKNQFAYTFDVQESCLDYLCNKITLQPILENAICHGINDLMRDGEIAVSVREDGDDVVFTVADNGSGMSGEQIISAAGNTPVIFYLEGKEVNFKSSREALDNGVAMVHQELNRALKRSVMDNIWLGRYPMIAGVMVDENMTLAAKYV